MIYHKNDSVIRFAFFGTGPIARFVLEELATRGVLPELVITAPDAPHGRGLQLAPSVVAAWASDHAIETWKPERLSAITTDLRAKDFPLFIVADYGSIIGREILEIPPRGILNVHPSLLPRLRGPSPIRGAILRDEKKTGVTIMLLDEEMDHGPIVAQKTVDIAAWPPRAPELEERLARAGGALLADVLPLWITDEIEARPQNHDVATYTEKLKKSDGEIRLSDDSYPNLLKIRALEGWPGAYTFFMRGDKKVRVAILDAHIEDDKLVIDRVKPEGKNEMAYEEFLRSSAQPI